MVQICAKVGYLRIDVDLVFPFELRPHASELKGVGSLSIWALVACSKNQAAAYLRFRAVSRVDIVENIDVHIVEDNAVRIGGRWTIVENVAKYDTCLGRRDLDSGLDALERVGAKSVLRWSFDELQIAKSCEFNRQVLESFRGLVDNQNVYTRENCQLADVMCYCMIVRAYPV